MMVRASKPFFLRLPLYWFGVNVTALLAGLFVLVFLRPGSATVASRPIRVLVTVWIVQNLLLVASTAHRAIDYVEAGPSSLGRFRTAEVAAYYDPTAFRSSDHDPVLIGLDLDRDGYARRR